MVATPRRGIIVASAWMPLRVAMGTDNLPLWVWTSQDEEGVSSLLARQNEHRRSAALKDALTVAAVQGQAFRLTFSRNVPIAGMFVAEIPGNQTFF
jgi:hypothetical protein